MDNTLLSVRELRKLLSQCKDGDKVVFGIREEAGMSNSEANFVDVHFDIPNVFYIELSTGET